MNVGRAIGLTTAVVTVIATVFAAGARAQNDGAVETDLLTIHHDSVSGELSFSVKGSDGEIVSGPIALHLLVDRLEQVGFAVDDSVGGSFRNDTLGVEVEVLGPRSVAVTWTPEDGAEHDFELDIPASNSARFYGTGERFNALNQRGYLLPIKTDDRADNKGVGSYKPIPFFMTSDGYGVWVDTYSPGYLDLTASDRFTAKLTFRDSRLRVVLMAGPQYSDILKSFTRLTGRVRVPPEWAFGLWKSRDVHPNQDSVYSDLIRLRAADIPASVIVIDSPWETGYNDFQINTTQFRDPEAMFDQIESHGFNLALWMTPFINKRNVMDMEGITEESSNYEEAAERGYLVADSSANVVLSQWWKGDGGLVDLTNPDAVAWWFRQIGKTKAYRVKAFKADDGEGNFVPDAVFHDGTPARKMKNRYSVLYDSLMQVYIDRELGGDGAMITRSGFTGTQRFSFDWAGDNRADFSYEDGLPSAILAAQNAALSGIALWGSDIAGYFGRPDPELFVRWAQFGAFSPLMQVHMTSNQGPWDFGEEELKAFRRFAKLRMQLFPYLYDAVHEAAQSGMPVIRPMALAFQGDRAAETSIYQYMFGPDLLVAPMYQPGTSRSVYLPAGSWIDWWDGGVFEGLQTIEVDVPLDRMPIFVRSGAIIPMIRDDVDTLVPRTAKTDSTVKTLDDRRIIEVWPGATGSFQTSDGLSARLKRSGTKAMLEIESAEARRIEVRLLYRDLVNLQGGAVSRPDYQRRRSTVVSLGQTAGRQVLTWEEE